MTKDEAYKIAREQYSNHLHQTSGVWSVSLETAKEICEVLEVDFDDAVLFQRECEDDDAYRLASEKHSEVSDVLSDAGLDLSEDFWSELGDSLKEKYGEEVARDEAYSEYFWDHVTTNAVTS